MKNLLLIPVIILIAGCEQRNLPNDVQAQYMAEQVIKAQLPDPESAEFEGENSKMAKFSDSSFVFDGIVSASNKFGLKVSLTYNVGIKYKGGDPQSDSSWTVKFCNLK